MNKKNQKSKKLKALYRKLHDYRDNPILHAETQQKILTIENSKK